MNAEIKAKWLAALRSGEYRQAHGALRRGEQFCCLGVLCDLHAAAGLGQWDGEKYLENTSLLPLMVSVWAELEGRNPIVDGISLTMQNDGEYDGDLRPHSFAEIADLIERYL